MLSLPDLTPRDLHSLWYTPINQPPQQPPKQQLQSLESNVAPNAAAQASQRRLLISHAHNSPLHALQLDEQSILRRKTNIQNFGASWIKPPGIYKSLHQQREEKREMEEHQEAVRREQLQAELEEAANMAALRAAGAGEGMEADLDDEIPDADEIEDEDDDDDDDGDEEEEDESEDEAPASIQPRRAALPAPPVWLRGEDAYRDGLARGGLGEGTFLGEEENVDVSQLLQEDDINPSQQELQAHDASRLDDIDMGVDMDAVDLDASALEASSMAGYEHTDTEDEEVSSMLEGISEASEVATRPSVTARTPAGYRRPVPRPGRHSFLSDGREQSLDLSGMDLRSSSLIEDDTSPAMMTRSRTLHSSGAQGADRR